MDMGNGAEQRMIAIDDHVYAVSDAGEGPAVLLLHGFPDTGSLWRHQVPALVAAGFRVLAPDLLGRGNTSAPRNPDDYAIGAMVPDMCGLLDALRIRRAHVVGHDFGAGLAWLLAAYQPDRVDHLVVLSVGHPRTGANPALWDLQMAWYQFFFQFTGITEELLQQDDWSLFRLCMQDARDMERYIQDLSRPGALTAALNWYRAMGPVPPVLRPARRVPDVQAPTMGLWSPGDIYLPEERMIASSASVKNRWRYERIEDATHWIPIDQPGQVNRLLMDFLPGQT